MTPCDVCGKKPRGFELFDYCAVCGATLCPEHIAAGHCGNKPAAAGQVEDFEDG